MILIRQKILELICWLKGHNWENPINPTNTYCQRCFKITGSFIGIVKCKVETNESIPKGALVMMSPSAVVLNSHDANLTQKEKIGVVIKEMVDKNQVVVLFGDKKTGN